MNLRSIVGSVLMAGMVLAGSQAWAQVVQQDVKHDVSPPLRDIIAPPNDSKIRHEKPLGRIPLPPSSGQADPVIQSSVGPKVAVTSGSNFDGVGVGFTGPNGSFAPNAAPPDTNGTVGATQYVQWVNESFAVFDKATGSVLMGPTAGNALWQGFGGGCQTNNDGDPIVQYDKAASRWVFTQFSVSTTPFLQCVAVSTTSDATGTYNRYAFTQSNFPDYPKLGVWPDAYYVTFNMFSGNRFVGANACAFDRSSMLAGATATQVCFQQSSSVASLLPSDLDGSMPPPAGSPNFMINFGTSSLNLFKFHVNFATPSSSTFTGPTTLAVAAFSPACGGGTCIPQQGTNQQLDSLADRLMYRFAYRNFGDHEALVVNHSVTAGSSVGVRWYEIRSPNATPSVFQQGTFAPDANFRWMGSIGMDHVGDIAVGYSVSSTGLFPSISFTGRVPGDALNTLEAESSIQAGGGSQNGGLNRWGDYSAMAIDPVDDCTFWYTNEYLKTSGSFNWSTRIASFKFPGCSSAPPVLTTISVSPASASVPTGGTKQFIATGFDQFGNPMNPQPTFTWSVSGGGTIDSSGLFTAGATAGGPFTVTAASGSVSGTASVTVTATPVLTTITVSPASASVQTGKTQQFTATGLDQFGNPMNPQPTFTWSVSGGGTISSSGLFTAGAAAGGPFTVTAASGSVSGTASVTVTSVPDFAISASPASQTVSRSSSTPYTVAIGALNGFNGTVSFSVSGLPGRGGNATFNPTTVTGSGNTTMTVSTAKKTQTGTFTLTIIGTSGSLSHSTTVQLVVQ